MWIIVDPELGLHKESRHDSLHTLTTMADSDSDYIGSSGNEGGASSSKKGRDGRIGENGKPREKPRERWEEVQRAWDVGLGEDIESTVAGLLEAGKKRRYPLLSIM